MREGEDDTGEGGQKDCRLLVELERDTEEGEEEGVRLLLVMLPALAALFKSP